MTNEFKPNNPLEEKLLAMYRKEIKIVEFLEILLDSQVIILADRRGYFRSRYAFQPTGHKLSPGARRARDLHQH